MKKFYGALGVIIIFLIAAVVFRDKPCGLYREFYNANRVSIILAESDADACGENVEFVNTGNEDLEVIVTKVIDDEGAFRTENEEEYTIKSGETAIIPVKESTTNGEFYAYFMNPDPIDDEASAPFKIQEHQE